MTIETTSANELVAYLRNVPPTNALYADAQLFAQAPAEEQAELLGIAWKLKRSGIRNMGPMMTWEITFALARCAAKYPVKR